MDPITLALIIAGLSTAGTLGATYMNNQSVRDTNEQNIQNQWDMWHATNQYNTPHEQMLRYAEAGLNPNLIYGQSNTTSPVNVGVAQPLDYSGLSNLLPTIMQTLLTRSQIRSTDAGTELTKENILAKIFENAVTPELLQEKLNISQRESYLKLRDIMNAIQLYETGELDLAEKKLEIQMKELHLNYDKAQAEAGFPPDLSPEHRAVLGMISQLVEWISNGKIKANDLISTIFNTPNYNNN